MTTCILLSNILATSAHGSSGPAVVAGVLGLAFLLLAAIFSVRIPRVDIWFGGLRRLWFIHHILGAASFLLLMIHPLLLGVAHAVPLSRSLPGALWAGGGAFALAAFAYRMLISRFVGRKRYTITTVCKIGPGVVELSLKPEGGILCYCAGQFVYMTPLDAGLAAGCGEEHPYTLSSAPVEPILRIAVKDLGDATHALQTAAIGGRVLIEGPYGGLFTSEKTPARQLWIAGGIGVTPFLGRARSLNPSRPEDIHLVYCVQDESRAHFLAELEMLAANRHGFKLWTHYFLREGPLNAAFLRSRCLDFADRDILLCGPPAMIAWCGKDATDAFNAKNHGHRHSPAARVLLPTYLIGTLSPSFDP